MGSWSVVSRSAQQTRAWGRRLGTLLEGGEIIGLIGELGAGKTCFVRGVAEGLDVDQEAWIRSPTFTLINEYPGRLPVFHIDLYRIESRNELEGLNLREYVYSDGVSLIEWFERLPVDEVGEYLELAIGNVESNKRELRFTAHGERYEKIVDSLRRQEFKGSKVQKFKSSKVQGLKH
jgi:tRNA threonylcarbamoyladenosine biosynthesis protein TsaE